MWCGANFYLCGEKQTQWQEFSLIKQLWLDCFCRNRTLTFYQKTSKLQFNVEDLGDHTFVFRFLLKVASIGKRLCFFCDLQRKELQNACHSIPDPKDQVSCIVNLVLPIVYCATQRKISKDDS